MNPMHVAQRVRDTLAPPIDAMNAHAAEVRRRGISVISLGQAVPGFAPFAGALQAARQALDEPDTHSYSADAGLPALRVAVAERLGRDNGLVIDPDSQLLITAGGNQAFMLALLTLLEPAEGVLLPSPYYLNHAMAVSITGGTPIEIPLSEASGFQLRLEDVEPFLDHGARALVLVTPSNPTGAVFDPVELERIARAAMARGITLITDETYQHYLYEGARHFSLASLPELRPHVITTGSFSKTFCLAGWRLGYLHAEAPFVREALKVQDSMVICAPVIGQKALLGALREPPEELARRCDMLAQRRRLLLERLTGMPQLHWEPTFGSLFAFVRVEGCTDSTAFAHDILERAHVVTTPGRAFGSSWESYLRLSYGTVDLPDLEEACRRLARYLSGGSGA
jgi:aminotransferase